ncbi:MAG: hypothetical protein IJS32_01970 [Kiritimatiellae bacterium]|nr:hypothetical protein [Kiritimatiellia bacterium]
MNNAERFFLGRLYTAGSGGFRETVEAGVTADDFTDPHAQAVWRFAAGLSEQNTNWPGDAVLEYWVDTLRLPAKDLTDWGDKAFTPEHTGFYAAELRKRRDLAKRAKLAEDRTCGRPLAEIAESLAEADVGAPAVEVAELSADAPMDIPETIDFPPGEVGELARWIYERSLYPFAPFAIVSSLVAWSVVLGRRVVVENQHPILYGLLVGRRATARISRSKLRVTFWARLAFPGATSWASSLP